MTMMTMMSGINQESASQPRLAKMDHTTTGSSATAAIDPDRLVIRQFENASNPSDNSPISVVATDPAGRCVTFALYGEDHTLGNALRFQLSQYSENEVEFCGYSMPHPSEAKVHLRVQVAEGAPKSVTAVGLLKRALLDLRTHYADIRTLTSAAFAQH